MVTMTEKNGVTMESKSETSFRARSTFAHLLGTSLLVCAGSVAPAFAADECGVAAAAVSCTNADAGYPAYSGITYTGVASSMELTINDPTITVGGRVYVAGTGAADISVDVTSVTTITTNASNAHAINAVTAGSGNTRVELNSGVVRTIGTRSNGLNAINTSTTNAGSATAVMTGGILNIGSYPRGVSSGLYAMTQGVGSVLTQMDGGTISVGGLESFGLYSRINNATNASTATALMTGGTINVGRGGGSSGLRVESRGTGDVLAQMDDGTINVTATNSRNNFMHGIRAEINNTASNGNITVQMNGGSILNVATSGPNRGGNGIYSRNRGLGASTVNIVGGTVVVTPAARRAGGNLAAGAYSRVANSASTADASVNLSGGSITTSVGRFLHGIQVVNNGSGAANATVSNGGTISASGDDSSGIHVTVFNAAASYNVSVTGAGSSVTSGTVTAAAIMTQSVAGSSGTIQVGDGATIDGTAGAAAILDVAGNTAVTIGGVVRGDIELGDGSDTLQFNSTADLSNITLFDGGDDSGTADGMTDTLTMNGLTYATALDPTLFVNWENFVLNNSTLTLAPGTLSIGTPSEAATGLSLVNGSTLNAGASLDLNGNASIDANSALLGTGAGSGVYNISGSVANNGRISTQDGVIGDIVTVSGDYTGSGTLLIDVDTSADTADVINITGNSSGSGFISVTNLTPGAASGNEIALVNVGGASSAGDFSLVGGSVSAGAYAYVLGYQSGTFSFVPTISATGTTYAALPFVLGSFNRLPTLKQRVGTREWSAGSDRQTGGWLRIHGDFETANFSTELGSFSADSSYQRTLYSTQAGFDKVFETGEADQLVAGLTAQYGQLSSTITSAAGTGSINGQGFGVGVTATWYGANGTYIDAQGQMNWLGVDVSSSDSTDPLISGETMRTSAFSLEVGHEFQINTSQSLVPQAQLTWGQVDGGSFTDSAGNSVNPGKYESLIGRLGLAYEFEIGQPNENEFTKAYVIGNLLHSFSNEASVTLNGSTMESNTASTWAEVGVGYSAMLNHGKTEVYGEASYRTAISGNNADSSGLSLTAGIAISF